MLDIKFQAQLAEATAGMMRACALATARAAGTSMAQGMSIWSRWLQASTAPTARADATVAWAAWPQACAAEDSVPTQDPPPAPAEPPADAAFSSYRSSSGYAVAQVIVPEPAS
ncbi:MAG: hypothetical protein K2X43_12460 [Hyphomonadaceae bacterium]|nr:hypothetical protein [Hyphomonadaceae bacterium]